MSEAYPRNQKTCKTCGAIFRVKPSHYDKKTYCSRACMATDYRERLRGANNPRYSAAGTRSCAGCGSSFQSYNKRARFCSVQCARASAEVRARMSERQRARWEEAPWPMPAPRPRVVPPPKPERILRRVERACAVCGAAFSVWPSRRAFTCSPECRRRFRALRQSGPRSHRWRGGKTPQSVLRRTNADYQVWRTAVFTRDNFTCQMCGQHGGRLAAHHIKTVREHPDLLLEVRNGITLCWPCHHGIQWKEARYVARFAAITGLMV